MALARQRADQWQRSKARADAAAAHAGDYAEGILQAEDHVMHMTSYNAYVILGVDD